MTLPNFLISGSAKCGTTSLYSYLQQHPQVFICVPKAKMFAVLRNPADRAYSAYIHTVRQGRERRSFEEALKLEPERIRQNWNPLWHFKAMGFYYEQVRRFFDMFGREQVRVYLYEDLQKTPLSLIREVFETLEVDASFVPDTTKRFKESYVPKIPALERTLNQTKYKVSLSQAYLPGPIAWRTKYVRSLIDRTADLNRARAPRIPSATRTALLDEYRDDIFRLGDLLRRDLTHWCNPVAAQVTSV